MMWFRGLVQRLQQFSFFDTFKHASTYFSGTLLVHLLGLVSLPVFTAYLTADEYGIVNVFTSYLLMTAVLITLNLHWAVSRYYFEEDKTDFEDFLGSIVLGVTVSFIVLGGLMWFFEAQMAVLLNLPVHLIKWLLLTAYLIVILAIFTQLMVATKQSKRQSIVQVAWQYGKFSLTVAGLIWLSGQTYWLDGQEESYTYMGKIIGEWIGTFFIACYALSQIYRHLSFKNLQWAHIRYALSFSIPLIPFALSNYILTSFDQWYIDQSIGHAQAGQYAFAYKIGMIYMGLGAALMDGANPSYYKYMNNKEHHSVWQQVDSMTKLLVLGACFLILFAIDAGTLLSSNPVFLEALPIAPVIVGAYVFHGISNFANRGIYFIKKNSYLAVIILISGVVNILLNAYFIPLYDYKAAAYTTLASYFLMMVLSIVVTTYILKLPPLPLGRILKYIVLLGAVVALNYVLGQPNIGMHFGWICFKGGLFLLLALLLYYNKIGVIFNKALTESNDTLNDPPT
ncbi:MAG: lipopolysaccharide biosynthesis protein [Aureispira sp.]